MLLSKVRGRKKGKEIEMKEFTWTGKTKRTIIKIRPQGQADVSRLDYLLKTGTTAYVLQKRNWLGKWSYPKDLMGSYKVRLSSSDQKNLVLDIIRNEGFKVCSLK